MAVEVNDLVAAQNLAAQALHRWRAEHLQVGRGLDPSQTVLQRPLVGQVGQVVEIQGPVDNHQNSKALGEGGILRHIKAAYGYYH